MDKDEQILQITAEKIAIDQCYLNSIREVLNLRKEIILKDKAINDYKNAIRAQIGNGGRSDKKRTYRVKEDLVIDHITGKTARLSKVIKGNLELLK